MQRVMQISDINLKEREDPKSRKGEKLQEKFLSQDGVTVSEYLRGVLEQHCQQVFL